MTPEWDNIYAGVLMPSGEPVLVAENEDGTKTVTLLNRRSS